MAHSTGYTYVEMAWWLNILGDCKDCFYAITSSHNDTDLMITDINTTAPLGDWIKISLVSEGLIGFYVWDVPHERKIRKKKTNKQRIPYTKLNKQNDSMLETQSVYVGKNPETNAFVSSTNPCNVYNL